MTREDKRQDYGEERLVCFGLLEADVVVMVYTERPKGPHVISCERQKNMKLVTTAKLPPCSLAAPSVRRLHHCAARPNSSGLAQK